MDSAREQRIRNLTSGGENLFLAMVEDYSNRLSKQGVKIHKVIDQIMMSTEEGLLEELDKGRTLYLDTSNRFIEFLQRTRTADSARELSAHGLVRESILSKIDVASAAAQKNASTLEHERHDSVTKSLKERDKTPSEYSSRWSRSHKPTASYILTQQRLKHERAKVQLEFMKREAQLLKQQAEMDVSLKLLRSERNLKEAEAELNVVHDLIEEENGSVDYIRSIKQERTEAFVNGVVDHMEGKEIKKEQLSPKPHESPPPPSHHTTAAPSSGNIPYQFAAVIQYNPSRLAVAYCSSIAVVGQ